MDEIKVTYRKDKESRWWVTVDIAGGQVEMDLGESMVLTGKLIEALNDINKREDNNGNKNNTT